MILTNSSITHQTNLSVSQPPVERRSCLARLSVLAILWTLHANPMSIHAQTSPPPNIGATNQTPPTAKPSRERFDDLVRDDFFSGDKEGLKRGMKVCEDTLAKDPNHAPALCWHGDGLIMESAQYFQSGDIPKGLELWERGLKEMDAAGALQPDNLQVLIPRGATLLAVAKYAYQPAEKTRMLKTGVADYEKVLKLQEPFFQMLSVHSRGELLFGLADGWFRLGDTAKSRAYLQRILIDCKGSPYAKNAAAWLATTDKKELGEKSAALTCIGCHNR